MNKAEHVIRSRLDDTFKKTAGADVELQAHWAKYLCVLTSGYLEESIRLILSQYVERKAAPRVARYVNRQLRGFQNPKMGSVLDLLGRFDKAWRDHVENEIADELKDAVDSIVANRHNIAHGRDVGITHAQVSRYYARVKQVVALIAAECAVASPSE